MTLLTLPQMADLFVDAVIVDDRRQLLFLSAWGQDTVLQEFLARVSVPKDKEGLSCFTLQNESHSCYVEIGDQHRLRKHTGRQTKDSSFNGLNHLWLYDVHAKYIDRANRRCLLLKQSQETEQDFFWRLWQTVREVCHVPLLNEWHFLVTRFLQSGWIKRFTGIGLEAFRIDLSSEEVENYISYLVQTGELSLLSISKEPEALTN